MRRFNSATCHYTGNSLCCFSVINLLFPGSPFLIYFLIFKEHTLQRVSEKGYKYFEVNILSLWKSENILILRYI